MSSTFLLYHIVFRPKNSKPVIDRQNEGMLYRFIWRYVSDKGCVLHAIGGMSDHIHLLVELTPSIAIADFVRDLKTSTSKFLKYNAKLFPFFECWATGYFAETHSLSQKDCIKSYIKGQKQHHATINFANELRQLYIESGLPVDRFFLAEE